MELLRLSDILSGLMKPITPFKVIDVGINRKAHM